MTAPTVYQNRVRTARDAYFAACQRRNQAALRIAYAHMFESLSDIHRMVESFKAADDMAEAHRENYRRVERRQPTT